MVGDSATALRLYHENNDATITVTISVLDYGFAVIRFDSVL